VLPFLNSFYGNSGTRFPKIVGIVYTRASFKTRVSSSIKLPRGRNQRRFIGRHASETILALKPVTFHYKTDKTNTLQFGLIAEEVAEINPDLVVRDKNGEIYAVRYDAVNAMLLNGFLKEHRKLQDQGTRTVELKKGIATLAATVKEQAAQIQKVSAQFETSKPAPRFVNNKNQ
jgi:hypothetical protein